MDQDTFVQSGFQTLDDAQLFNARRLQTGLHFLLTVQLDHEFVFDGQHSDYAQQYYHRYLAGDVAQQLTMYRHADVPPEIRLELRNVNLRWEDVPGLLQRALLWDFGYVIALDKRLTKIYTRCGRSMAQIFVPYKSYSRIGCTPKLCSVSTGEIFRRHKFCDGDQAAAISLCAADEALQDGHAAMWGDGADPDFIPEPNLVRHAWTDHNSSYLMYAIHAEWNGVAYNFCPRRPSPVIPCVPIAFADAARWCRPVRGKIVVPWLARFAAENRPGDQWTMVLIIVAICAVGASCYVGWTYSKKKPWQSFRRSELRRRLLHSSSRSGSSFSSSSASISHLDDDNEDGDGHDYERALDRAAHKYFDSTIGLSASAHDGASTTHSSSDPARSGGSSDDGPGSEGSTLQRSAREQLKRSGSSTSSIRLLSGHRNQVAIRSFHLFESHHMIRRKRIPFRELQYQRVLSQGTSGEVWLAQLRGRQVAVKQLLPTKRRVLREMEMFMAEVYLCMQLRHPNIVSLVGVAWNTLEHVVMVQELMARGDLRHFLEFQAENPASQDSPSVFTWEKQKLSMAQGIASALAYLHNLSPQLLHRDVKSKNVLLSDRMEVKLCDFGISRRKHDMDEADTNLTITEAAGTMSWTAPELLLGDMYDEKVDIYSLGILLCEIDTCELPYHDAASLESRLIFHPLRLMKLVIYEGLRPAISPEPRPRLQICPTCQGHRIEKVAYNHMLLDRTCSKCDGEGVLQSNAAGNSQGARSAPANSVRSA
ncbi:hypothetical protein P43SY_000828 [Pythium insidiosum]|uniref:Protein kinase domain-containing protein n=1 Tax=Pythium insidiosum TaxID=114742 RepID=A0AAD5Q999_PYTIN|nr:hypothetical protein P43SY_000828 [Pythium insidiosum]